MVLAKRAKEDGFSGMGQAGKSRKCENLVNPTDLGVECLSRGRRLQFVEF